MGRGLQYGWRAVNMNGPPGNTFTLVDYAFGSPGPGDHCRPRGPTGLDRRHRHQLGHRRQLEYRRRPRRRPPARRTPTRPCSIRTPPIRRWLIDAGRNLQNITFDNGGGLLTTSLTIGTTSGNALLLTSRRHDPNHRDRSPILRRQRPAGAGRGTYTFTSGASTAVPPRSTSAARSCPPPPAAPPR